MDSDMLALPKLVKELGHGEDVLKTVKLLEQIE